MNRRSPKRRPRARLPLGGGHDEGLEVEGVVEASLAPAERSQEAGVGVGADAAKRFQLAHFRF
jgi:hypothetical protein